MPTTDTIRRKHSCCVGCRLPLSVVEPQVICRFATRGFSWNAGAPQPARPCHTRYHLGCIRVGIPFRTRLENNKGLCLPLLRDFPGFICEACTVRAVLGRELGSGPKDYALLMLERMRIVDTVNSLSSGTHKTYQQKMGYLRRFALSFQVPTMLSITPVERPPAAKAIPLMWAQQHYSLQKSRWSRRKGDHAEDARVTFATSRGLRSAASMFYKLDFLTAHPGKVYIDHNKRVLVTDAVSPTDDLGYAMMNSGMQQRLGSEAVPSVTLLERHVRYLDVSLRQRFQAATSKSVKKELARAGLANSTAWLAWTRASETFGLRFSDVDLTLRGEGVKHDLPPAVGVIQLRLASQTKSDRFKTADVVIAHTTASGMSAGFWLEHLLHLCELTRHDMPTCEDFLFQHANGSKWTSHYFCTTFLYPSLLEQRATDAKLRPFDGTPGNAIADKFYSMHSYRRGARSHVSRKRPGYLRPATNVKVDEHGRWQIKRRNMNMRTAYLEWGIAARISITLFCM